MHFSDPSKAVQNRSSRDRRPRRRRRSPSGGRPTHIVVTHRPLQFEAAPYDATPIAFTSLSLDTRLERALTDRGFEMTTPIQSAVLPSRVRRHRPGRLCRDRHRQDAGLSLPLMQRLLGATGALGCDGCGRRTDARLDSGADARACGADRRRISGAGVPHQSVERRRVWRCRVGAAGARSAGLGRHRRGHAGPPARSHGHQRRQVRRASTCSCSTRRTACSTWASGRASGASSRRCRRTGRRCCSRRRCPTK